MDSYTAVAELATGKSEITAEERQVWKRLYLSLLYGGGVRTVQSQFDISRAEAKDLISKFHKNWPAVRALQDDVLDIAQKRGYIRTPWGRHLHIPEYGEHKMLNSLIQGSAADLMKASIVRVDDWLRHEAVGLDSRMVSVIHDEIIFDGPESEIEGLHINVPPLMREDWLHEVVPIEVDHEVSTTNWANKESYESWQQKQTSPTSSR